MRAAVLLGLFLTGCATTAPRFGQELAASFAQDDMRKLVTPELELYYPAQHRAGAEQVAARAAECLRAFRAHDRSQRPRDRALLFLTSANFNNAYVGGLSLGEPLHSVNPLSVTSELFHWYGLGGAQAGDIACHEMFHLVHYEQTGNFWRVVNAALGPVHAPQIWLERWFTEGVAQYYEGRVFKPVGRPFSPLYRGAFDSFVALRQGSVQAGDLSLWQRELYPFTGAYLTGHAFVEWLVATYGEEKLWQVMDTQGRSVFSPLGATLRVKSAYGSSIGALLDEWQATLTRDLVRRERRAEQRVLRDDLGQLARLASHPQSGALAVVSSGNEQVPMLRVFEADGALRLERRLVRLGTDRDWVYAGPSTMSGLSFSADGRWLFLLNDDLTHVGDTRAQLWRIDARTGEVARVIQDVGRGMGGGVAPDGRSFTFVDLPPGRARIVERDLETQGERTVLELPPGVTVSAPQWDPRHERLVFSRLDPEGWNLVLREADGTLRPLTTDGAFNYGARWADDGHVVFSRTAGRYLQVHRLDVTTLELERLTDAPYGAIDPAPVPGGVAFVNRVGVQWSLDVAPAQALERASLAAPADGAPVTADAAIDGGALEEQAGVGDGGQPGDAGVARHESPPLVVESDEAYSPVDHLFLPQLRVPGVSSFFLRPQQAVPFGAQLYGGVMGRDRLGKHAWAVNATLWVPTLESSVWVGYRNLALAPWYVSVNAARDGFREEAFWSGSITAGRRVFTAPVWFGVQTEVWQPFDRLAEKFVGPTLGVSYSAGDGTAYGGPQRAFSFSFNAAGYPRAFGSDRDLLDLRVGVSLSLPPPLFKRHSFTLAAAGRALPGAPAGVLRVGGVPSMTTLFTRGYEGELPSRPNVFLPGSFVESLRGFDDFPMRATNAALFNATYTHHIVIDRGFASVLWVLPSLFFRQVDVDVFGSAALTDDASFRWARAVGASVSLRAVLGGLVPLSLTYQFAWRFDFGLPPLHVVGVAFD